MEEHDEKQLYISRQNLHDLRNIYAVLTDILHKNINKVCLVVALVSRRLHPDTAVDSIAEGQQLFWPLLNEQVSLIPTLATAGMQSIGGVQRNGRHIVLEATKLSRALSRIHISSHAYTHSTH